MKTLIKPESLSGKYELFVKVGEADSMPAIEEVERKYLAKNWKEKKATQIMKGNCQLPSAKADGL